jgi:hypothetical protein
VAGSESNIRVTIVGLSAGTKYKFSVVAVSKDGQVSAATTVSASTQKYIADKVVKKGKATLTSVQFSLTKNAKMKTNGYEVGYEIAVYAGKVTKTSQPIGTIKILPDGSVWDNGGFIVDDKIDLTKPIMVEGLQTSTKYTFHVKSVANGYAGHEVESQIRKVSINTLKFTAPKSMKPTASPAGSNSTKLKWNVDMKLDAYKTDSVTYQVILMDGKKEVGTWTDLTLVADGAPTTKGSVTGTLTMGSGFIFDPQTKYTFSVRAVTVVDGVSVYSLLGKLSFKTPKVV